MTGDDDGAKGVLVTGVVPARKRVGRRKALLLKKKNERGRTMVTNYFRHQVRR